MEAQRDRHASLAHRLPGGQRHVGGDVRINSRVDGDEIVHFILVQGEERPRASAGPENGGTDPPTATTTPPLGSTPLPVDPKLAPTPIPRPLPPPNGGSAYGSVD
jgi:hypothetical protein